MVEQSFGELLRVARRGAGLSQEDLAAASGSSVRTIREIERCRVRAPQRRTVLTMADALGLSGDLRERFVELSQVNRFIGSDARAARAPFTAGPTLRVPRQLPAAVPGLVGRGVASCVQCSKSHATNNGAAQSFLERCAPSHSAVCLAL